MSWVRQGVIEWFLTFGEANEIATKGFANLTATAAVATALFTVPASATIFSGHDFNLVGVQEWPEPPVTRGPTILPDGSMQMTDAIRQRAAAWLTTPLAVTDSFTATFSFSLAKLTQILQADGIALALQDEGPAVYGHDGSGIGYDDLNAVGSTIQTWTNNTAGLNITGKASDTQAAPTDLGAAQLITGSQIVNYNAITHSLNLLATLVVDGTTYQITDSKTIDLSSKFTGPNMYLGFTSATGAGLADQRITTFELVTTPIPIPAGIWLVGSALAGIFSIRRRAS